MSTILFSLPGNEKLTDSLIQLLSAERGDCIIRHFPDMESYIKINSDVKNKRVILVCTLDHPDTKLLPLFFLAQTLKEFGAKHICLVAPYLAYMRQDKRFQSGESITSTYFAKLVSSFVDSLITIDPHLHRRSALSEIYSIPTTVLHASALISSWIKENITNAVLIGPDGESEQWVSEVANNAGVPYIVLQKIRHGDRDVDVSVPHIEKYKNHIPILVDDIISTGRTMIETINHLKNAGMNKPICIGVHGVFADNSYQELLKAGALKIITTNTIPHESNSINIDQILYNSILSSNT